MDDDEAARRPTSLPTVKVVGPCKSGKSTLVAGLHRFGYGARPCAQEHSEVASMWQRVAPCDVLIFLDASLATIQARSTRADWSAERLAQQRRRLAHARLHCDLYLPTDGLDPAQVLARVRAFLEG